MAPPPCELPFWPSNPRPGDGMKDMDSGDPSRDDDVPSSMRTMVSSRMEWDGVPEPELYFNAWFSSASWFEDAA